MKYVTIFESKNSDPIVIKRLFDVLILISFSFLFLQMPVRDVYVITDTGK